MLKGDGMRKSSSLGLSSIAVSLLLLSLPIAQTAAPKPAIKPHRFYWTVTLEYTSMGLIPLDWDSDLPWVPTGPPISISLEEKFIDGHLCCLTTIVENVVAPSYEGTFLHKIRVLWIDEFGPGAKTTGVFSFSDGTGYFEGVKAHGKVWVEYTDLTGPIEGGPVLIQYEVGTILWTGA